MFENRVLEAGGSRGWEEQASKTDHIRGNSLRRPRTNFRTSRGVAYDVFHTMGIDRTGISVILAAVKLQHHGQRGHRMALFQ